MQQDNNNNNKQEHRDKLEKLEKALEDLEKHVQNLLIKYPGQQFCNSLIIALDLMNAMKNQLKEAIDYEKQQHSAPTFKRKG